MRAGIDEVGRGCIVGAVVAAVVMLDPQRPIAGLTDSKKLSDKKRRLLAAEIKASAVCWAIGRAEASEIDRLNIHHASLLAMQRAFHAMTIQPDYVRVDGRFLPDLPCPGEAVVQGDLTIPEISAASILAKVSRDDEMRVLDCLYPGYGFVKHKGYPTQAHLSALQQLGACPLHRTSYAPVQSAIGQFGQICRLNSQI